MMNVAPIFSGTVCSQVRTPTVPFFEKFCCQGVTLPETLERIRPCQLEMKRAQLMIGCKSILSRKATGRRERNIEIGSGRGKERANLWAVWEKGGPGEGRFVGRAVQGEGLRSGCPPDWNFNPRSRPNLTLMFVFFSLPLLFFFSFSFDARSEPWTHCV